MAKHPRSGFTLIELLIFSAIFSLIIGAFITILIVMVNIQSSQSASGEAEQQGQFLVQQFQYYVESARLVDMPQDVATSTLTLRESLASSSYDPTVFSVSSGTIYLQQGTSSPQAMTSNKVTISNVSFTRHYNTNSSSSAIGTDSVSYSFVVTSNAGNQQYSQTFQSSVAVLAPVGQIALIQQAKVEDNTGSSPPKLFESFPSNNESGDLLIAVIAYRGGATTGMTDFNGNSWSMISSTTVWSSTGGVTGTIAMYEAPNVAGGANGVTVSFTGTANFPSMMIYEYRGATAASPLDKSAAQAQLGMSAPTSPSVSPASGAELLFGVDDNSAPTSATFSPGEGYSLESSSTAGNTTQVFVEDTDQYIEDPVAASWQSSVLTSSTAMLATFKSASVAGPNPVVRGTGIQASSASSYTIAWPAGTQAGDLAVILYGGGYNVSSAPTGWTENETTGGTSNWGGTVLSKVLTSGDISAGSVVVNTVGTYDGVASIVTFVGAPGIREVDFQQAGSGATPVTVNSTIAPTNTDTAIYFASNRAASTDTMNRGTLRQQANDAGNASGALYTETLSGNGSFSAVGSYSSAGAGYYQATVVVTPSYNAGMVDYFPLDEGSGSTATDYSGNGHTGTWSGTQAGTGGTYYTTGKVGLYAGYFDGTTDYMRGSYTPASGSNFTLSGWFKATSCTAPLSSGRQMLIAIGTDSGSGTTAFLNLYTANNCEVTLGDANDTIVYTVPSAVTVGVWTYVAATYNGSTVSVYVNGALAGSEAFSGYNLAAGTASLGEYVSPITGYKFAGGIDDARVYNRALSATEIAALYNSQK